MRNLTIFLLVVLQLLFIQLPAHAKIRIVGSSTLYPFITLISERFGKYYDFGTPIVESTGTGGGFQLFCMNQDRKLSLISMASRQISSSELNLCRQNNNSDLLELQIGFDGIIIANSINAVAFNIEQKHLFLALAKKVPYQGKLVDNSYRNWHEIDPALPNQKIEIYGPPISSGTRVSFVELVMQRYCQNLVEFVKEYPNSTERKKICSLMREDGAFIESGDNENLLIQKLAMNKEIVGMFGYNFLKNNSDIVHPAVIDRVTPNLTTIKNQTYPLSRPLYIYLKKSDLETNQDLKLFLEQTFSKEAMNEYGYLVRKGLVPLDDKEIHKIIKLLD